MGKESGVGQGSSGVQGSSVVQCLRSIGQSSVGIGSSGVVAGSSDVGAGSSGLGVSSSGVDNEGQGLQGVDLLDYLQSYGGGEGIEVDHEDEDRTSSSEDDDYNPIPKDDDYDQYGVDDDDWLDDVEHEEASHKKGESEGTVGTTHEEPDFEDNEDMFAEQESDEEPPNYIVNFDGEKEEIGLYFNPKTDMRRPVFKLGMMFGTVQILRDALREMAHEHTLIVKGYNPKHTCTRKYNNNMVKQRFLVAKFKDQIAVNEHWKPDSLAKAMNASIRARVSSQMTYKVKRAALLEVDGSIKFQFAWLRDYGNELKRADPDTTVDIKCDFSSTSKNPVFKRMYICLGALKNGIKAGCRSVIGLDGAHLKSAFGGQLLTAVGLDANNTSWVVAYAMVEMGNKDSWIWFLELLCKDLKIKEDGAG
ncbi:uncharacterized protein LOC133730686 [Rosa rugosa]|uniref:uncharacterized protein LOC133730686 n=1 Tax=Rosa rugosa TaxID=74645 RepID=UPI002B403898|nr:uncharacterized protein LOC133730686 [Rosa rugosa]